MCKVSLLGVLALLVVAGCKSVDVEQVKEGSVALSGNWSFVYYEATDTNDGTMPGPPFESLRFANQKQVYVRQVGYRQPVLCDYEVQGDEFGVRVPVGRLGRVLVKCQAYLAEGGNLLVLRDRGTGAVFIRTESLISESRKLAGNWLVTAGRTACQERVTVSHGGGIVFRDSGLRGEYRLWSSDAGLMLSTFLFKEGRGLHTVVWQIEDQGANKLKLTPYGPSGMNRHKAMIWHRVVSPIGVLGK